MEVLWSRGWLGYPSIGCRKSLFFSLGRHKVRFSFSFHSWISMCIFPLFFTLPQWKRRKRGRLRCRRDHVFCSPNLVYRNRYMGAYSIFYPIKQVLPPYVQHSQFLPTHSYLNHGSYHVFLWSGFLSWSGIKKTSTAYVKNKNLICKTSRMIGVKSIFLALYRYES